MPRFREAFGAGLRQYGYVEDESIQVEHRYARGDPDRYATLTQELIRLRVRVIAVADSLAIPRVIATTSTTPVVMMTGGDVVGQGLAASLARPGGNVTGISSYSAEIQPRRLTLLRSLAPELGCVAYLWNARNESKRPDCEAMRAAARAMQVRLVTPPIRRAEDFRPAFATAGAAGAEALVVQPDALTNLSIRLLVELAADFGRPALYGAREYADAGGLLAYGPSRLHMARRAATYVAAILDGATPGELPIEECREAELVVNLRTAAAQQIVVPAAVIAQATAVIA